MNELQGLAKQAAASRPVFEWELRDTVAALRMILKGETFRDHRSDTAYSLNMDDHKCVVGHVAHNGIGHGKLDAGLINVLRWMVVGFDPDAVITSGRVLARARTVPGLDCPFCMGTVDECRERTTNSITGHIVREDVRYDACEHFIAARQEVLGDNTTFGTFAYFVANKVDYHHCDKCERFTPDEDDKCQWCGQYSWDRNETEPSDD